MMRDRFAGAEGEVAASGQTRRRQDHRARRRQGRRLPRRGRHDDAAVGDLHAHGLHRRLESGRADVGLPVPRLTIQAEGRRDLGSGRIAAAGRIEIGQARRQAHRRAYKWEARQCTNAPVEMRIEMGRLAAVLVVCLTIPGVGFSQPPPQPPSPPQATQPPNAPPPVTYSVDVIETMPLPALNLTIEQSPCTRADSWRG